MSKIFNLVRKIKVTLASNEQYAQILRSGGG